MTSARAGGDSRLAVAAAALAVFVAFTVSALMSALLDLASPVTSVADRVIDGSPTPVKEWAIDTFGTADKLVLGIGIALIMFGLAAWLAVAAMRRRQLLAIGVGAFVVVGIAASEESLLDALVVVGLPGIAAWLALQFTVPEGAASEPTTLLASFDDAAETEATDSTTAVEPMVRPMWAAPVDRRAFMARASAISIAAAGAGGAAALVGRERDAELVAAAGDLPPLSLVPGAEGPTVGPGAMVDGAPGPFLTPTDEFYRIDTAFTVPRVSIDDWTLVVDGMVDRPLELTYQDISEREIIERVVTLSCVSNEVGGDLVGTARWLGTPLASILEEAGVQDGATQIAMESDDGWTCGFPTEIALDGRDALLAIGMNGEPLPIRHGFPARVVVPGLYGYVSATKWITNITLTTWDDFDGFWIPRGWNKEGPISIQSRIDVPEAGETVPSGATVVAGIAWSPHTGVDGVEVSVDGGDWVEATLGDEVTVDAWRQWRAEVDLSAGQHELRVRATDGDGELQTSEVVRSGPGEATGWHTIAIEAS